MCHLTTIVSGAVSLGVLAGVLSGIVYVVLVGLKWVGWPRARPPPSEAIDNRRGHLHLARGPSRRTDRDTGKLRLSLEEEALKGRRDDRFFPESLCTKCRTLNGTLSNGCGRSEECCDDSTCNVSNCPESANHLKKRGSRRISEIWSEEKDAGTIDSEDSNDPKTIRIREEIEKLVEEMVGGSLDGVSVGKLSNHSSYLAMFAKHHEPICQALAKLGYALHVSLLNKKGSDSDSPRIAHSTLKALVEKVVAEAMKLPNISEILRSSNSAEDIGNDNNISNKSYEDILATAILNKVIEKCQKREGLGNSKKYKRSTTKTVRNRNNNIVNNEDEGDDNDIMYNSDWSDTSRSEQLSLTIEEHIEEITTTYENSEEEEFNEEINYNGAIPFPESGRIILDGDRGNSEDDCDAHSSVTEIITTGNSWEENWLFQRKKLRSGAKSHHPVPVPMLVPNPSQDFRALIGGVDADDLSDMSECESSVLEDIVLAADDDKDNSQILEEVKEDAVINSTNNNDGGNEITGMTEADENVTDAVGSPMSLNSESSCPSLSQKERDVSVDYECFRKFQIELRDTPQTRPGSLELPAAESEEYNTPIKCRIALREKEKWNHGVPLADNPYSAENILKREQRKKLEYFRTGYRSGEAVEFPGDSPEGITEEPTYEIYSRDYYIKASRCPTGDPNLRSTPETEDFESSEEVWKHMSEAKEGLSKGEGNSAVGNGPVDDVAEGKASDSKIVERKVIDYWEEGVLRNRIAQATNIVLPNVKELTKKFARGMEEFSPKPSPTQSASSQGYINGFGELKKEGTPSGIYLPTANEPEIEGSKSNVVNGNLSSSTSVTSRSNVSTGMQTNAVNETEICDNAKTPTKIEEEEREEEKEKEEEEKKKKKVGTGESKEPVKVSSSVTFTKSPGKEVHSLTARSISKEFREELKNNSSRRFLAKVDRGSSGESDHVEIASESMRNRSPTPPIDLQSKRKFWEDIISNSQK